MVIRFVMTKQQDRQQNRDTEALILQAAEREFLNKGFLGARTTSIAESAGVTHAMFHYYFRTKEKLFERIISEKFTLLRDAVLNSVGDLEAPLCEILRKAIDSHLDFIASNPDLPRFLVVEIFNNPERSAKLMDILGNVGSAFVSMLQMKINHEADLGVCRKVDARMLMLDIISLNVFAYVAGPAVNAAFGGCMSDADAFLQQRKKENYDTIMRKLRP